MKIRPETSAEFSAIHTLIQTAFQTAHVSDGDEQDYAAALRVGGHYLPDLALVAEEHGILAGHIMLTQTWVETPSGPWEALLVAPLSVALEFRDKGVGSALLRCGMERGARAGYKAAFLLGDPNYYHRFGFEPASHYGIHWKKDLTGTLDENVMVCTLFSGGLEGISGTVDF